MHHQACSSLFPQNRNYVKSYFWIRYIKIVDWIIYSKKGGFHLKIEILYRHRTLSVSITITKIHIENTKISFFSVFKNPNIGFGITTLLNE